MTHLWEIKHPYYCSDTNYWVDGVHPNTHGQNIWDSWADYLAEFGLEDTDMDYNLVFRWDWKRPEDDDYGYHVPDDSLHLYHMQQRKGNFQVHIIRVTEADEESVREYLSAYADHMRKIWEPLL